MYELTITKGEKLAIAFVASRGYAVEVAKLFTDHGVREDVAYAVSEDEPHENDVHTLAIPEHMAWAIADELENNGGHGFGPLCEALSAKLYRLVDSIV